MDELWKNYFEDPSDVNQNAIVESNMGLVRHIADGICKALPSGIDIDDITQAGTIGLISSVPRYNPKYGAAFRTFAYYRIRGEILALINREIKYRTNDGSGKLLELNESIPVEHCFPDIDSPEETIREKCKGMPPKYLEVFVLRYAEGMSFTEIAKILGRSAAAISLRHNRGLAFIKNPAILGEFAQFSP